MALENKDVVMWGLAAAVIGLVFFVHCTPKKERYEEDYEEDYEDE